MRMLGEGLKSLGHISRDEPQAITLVSYEPLKVSKRQYDFCERKI